MRQKIRYFVRESEILKMVAEEIGEEALSDKPFLRETLTKGWGNGYAVIPPGHPMHGQEELDVYVHGGVTFAAHAKEIDWPEILPEDRDGWVVGFDTTHAMDTPERCDRAYVEREAQSLAGQLETMWSE